MPRMAPRSLRYLGPLLGILVRILSRNGEGVSCTRREMAQERLLLCVCRDGGRGAGFVTQRVELSAEQASELTTGTARCVAVDPSTFNAVFLLR